MLKTNKVEIIKQLEKDVNINFYSFVDEDEDTLVAKSHFFNFAFGKDCICIETKYPVPGKELKKYFKENLPIVFKYDVENFLPDLLETVDKLYDNCLYLEYKENFPE